MTFKEMFGDARWVGTGNDNDMPIITDTFTAKAGEDAKITIVGFGVFTLYINGKRVHDTECLPLASDFEDSNFPRGEILSHRVYAEVFDISKLLVDGENRIAVILGNGWYNKPIWEETFGDGNKKVCWRMVFGDGREHLSSPESAKWLPSPVTANHYNKGEDQDLRLRDPRELNGISELELRSTVEEASLNRTCYYFSDCPRDKKVRTITPSVILEGDGYRIYDLGINTTGYPFVKLLGGAGDSVRILFSEAMSDDGKDISMLNCHGQRFNIIDDGKGKTVRPFHGWICARYARLEGKAEIVFFDEVYADVKTSTEFECDNETLNYIYEVFLHTQLINMHTGMPSDCPQIERRGYTGDGQLIAHSAMLMTDSKAFYRKWLYDISDCQDRVSGHVQYTAPYTHAGGGPGGWGSAIASVPYEFYLRFGDSEPMTEMYGQMHKYLEYLDSHSDNMLVTHDRDGEWCLGDWCPPSNKVIIPPPFVNNYFYVKTCKTMIEIARIIGREEDIGPLRQRIAARQKATRVTYVSMYDGVALGGLQGADAFALDMGIGDYRTKEHFIEYYDKLGYYDTGIFGTEIVTRLLFEYGRADIAIRLLSAGEPHGFGRFKRLGYTTLPEYWLGNARSHAHPMFGAVAAHLFDYVLGIRMEENTVGYTNVVISPLATEQVRSAKGSVVNMHGDKISVEYKNEDGELTVQITVPASTKATLRLGECDIPLHEGKNNIKI